ncbi:MAG: response regulator [Proteobacteria bacterium]|nr:response regulator [Pseudomonadota bacterium]
MLDRINELSLLLIEDNQGDADLFREYLADCPHQQFCITHVTKLDKALTKLAKERFDLIVIDLILPDSSGIATIEQIHGAAPRIPAVVLSGIADDELGQQAMAAGVQDFIHKDALDADSLGRSLRHATERGRLQSQFRSLVENNADAIVVVNCEGVVTYLNKAAEVLYGRGRDEIIGGPFGFQIHGDDIVEIELALPDGGVRSAEMRAAPIDWEGESAWLASIRDVTDRRRAEELQRRLYHADRLASIGQLASGVAHEINNPASFIQGNLETLKDHLSRLREVLSAALKDRASDASGTVETRSRVDRTSRRAMPRGIPTEPDGRAAGYSIVDRARVDALVDEMSTMLRDNLAGIERIAKIVKALGSFSRIERDEVEPVDLNEIIDVAVSMTFNEIRHRAVLRKELGPIPLIVADRGKLAQVFTNLLINAAQAIEPGAADQNLIWVSSFATQNEIVTLIEDSGCGIPAEDVDRIFTPFFTTKPRGQGTGLGLPLSVDIIRKHDGQIRVTSTVGQGTRFEVKLPIKNPCEPCAVEPAPSKLHHAAESSRARVLLIDDESMLLESLHRMLRRSHEVVMAEGGLAGITTLEHNAAFDVLICDLMMPKVDGIRFYQIVSQRWPALVQRIVFCSGGAFTDHAKDFIGTVREDNVVIEKPVKQRILLDAVDLVMQKHGPLREHW